MGAAKKSKAAKKKAATAAPEEPTPAPLPAWMTGDKEAIKSLPKSPPTIRPVKVEIVWAGGYDPNDPSTHHDPTLPPGKGEP